MATQPLHFTGPKHLLGWLRGHAAGESILHEAMVPLCEGCRFNRRPVLVTLHSDGLVVAIGHRIDIHMAVTMHSDTEEGREFAEDYLERGLSQKFRDLMWQAAFAVGVERQQFTGARGMCRKHTRDDEIRRLQSLIFLRDLAAWRKRWRGQFGEQAIDEIARDAKVSMLDL